MSSRPQTTRNRVLGLWNAEDMQVVLLDTPGLHDAWTVFNQRMVAVSEGVLDEVEAICWILDIEPLVAALAKGAPILDAQLITVRDRVLARGVPLLLVLNKIDRVQKEQALPVIAALAELSPLIVPLSAKKGTGLDALAKAIRRVLPVQPGLYPQDQLTTETERFIVAELIRERVMEHTEQEVPYATAVDIERFDESSREAGKVHIHAKILVEKESQKAIVIGQGGKMIKRIGTEARKTIAGLLGCQVRLDLFVVVERDWTRNPRLLRELGLDG